MFTTSPIVHKKSLFCKCENVTTVKINNWLHIFKAETAALVGLTAEETQVVAVYGFFWHSQ